MWQACLGIWIGVILLDRIDPRSTSTNGSAYDGRLAYFATPKGLVAVDRTGKAIWTYSPNGWNLGWKPFPSLRGVALYYGVRTVIWVETRE